MQRLWLALLLSLAWPSRAWAGPVEDFEAIVQKIWHTVDQKRQAGEISREQEYVDG